MDIRYYISDFRLQPFLGGGEFTNAVTGKIKLASQTLSTIDGHWDEKVMIKDKRTGVNKHQKPFWFIYTGHDSDNYKHGYSH